MLAQHFPDDFDGVVSEVPVIHWSGLFSNFVSFTKPRYHGGGLNSAKTWPIATAVNQACDALDGMADGVIQNYLACPARLDVQALRCARANDAGDTCLSDAQISTFKGTFEPTALPFALWLHALEQSQAGVWAGRRLVLRRAAHHDLAVAAQGAEIAARHVRHGMRE